MLNVGVRIRSKHLQSDQRTVKIKRLGTDIQSRVDWILFALVRGTRGQNTIGQWQRYRGKLGATKIASEILFLHVRLPVKTAWRYETVKRTEQHTRQRSVAQA